MLRNILDCLKVAKGETENIRIAKGKYHLPDTFKGTINSIKNEIRWR
jgi:hypothetical protein